MADDSAVKLDAQLYAVNGQRAIVRSGAALDSTKIGTIPGGTIVTALDERMIDNTMRVCIGRDRWVTRITSRGKVLLKDLVRRPLVRSGLAKQQPALYSQPEPKLEPEPKE